MNNTSSIDSEKKNKVQKDVFFVNSSTFVADAELKSRNLIEQQIIQ
jgi:hypothetical protein